MTQKIRKSLLALGAGVAMLAAVPASAATVTDFYDYNGIWVGQVTVDDNGNWCHLSGPWGPVATTTTTNIGHYLCP